MLKFVFVYLANTAVLCYSLTIICCCQEWQDGAIPGKKLKKPSRTLEEVSQAKKQYEQKRSNEKKILLFVVIISSV
jgi:hypothetical protein